MANKQIVLNLDEDDYHHVMRAANARKQMGYIPDGNSDQLGEAIAEICRGWGEQMGFFTWAEQEGSKDADDKD